MKARLLRVIGLCVALSFTFLLGACHKKTAAVLPPKAVLPPPAKPAVTLSVNPPEVQRGAAAKLQWSVQNATDVKIDALGAVASDGSTTITPSESTTYTLTALGPGGSVQSSARVTVTAPAAPTPVKAALSDQELFEKNVKDIYFNYDRYDIRPADAATLKSDESFLSAHADYKLTISGNCDERGSEEYNLALGASRASSVRDALVKLGIASSRMKTISYGKEEPTCTEHNEECWQRNRRAHLSNQ